MGGITQPSSCAGSRMRSHHPSSPLFALLLVLALLPWAGDAHAARAGRRAADPPPKPEPVPLTVENRTGSELIGIRVERKEGREIIGLALGPGGDDTLENPGGTAGLRLDLGLALWFFDDVPLGTARRMTVAEADGGPALTLATADRGGERRTLKGRAQSLLPEAGARPVCELTRFRPGMRMDEVCAVVEADPRRDDSEAVLTTLGYAGVTWAARLTAAPAMGGADGTPGGRVLAGVELRQILTRERLDAVRGLLAKQGFAPWQAEFPGVDLNFAGMDALPRDRREALLQQILDLFMEAGSGDAGITLAPADMLPSLANADDPPEGVRVFNLTLNRSTGILVVNMAAYNSQI